MTAILQWPPLDALEDALVLCPCCDEDVRHHDVGCNPTTQRLARKRRERETETEIAA